MHGFSIIVPVKEINDYIRESIPITLGMDYKNFEIIILPNDPTPREELPEFLKHPQVSIISTGRVSPAVKRDIGAEKAKYDYLAFLDDDAYPTPDWLKVAEKLFAEQTVAAIGGPGVTPPGSSLGEQASGLFFETYIGGGGMDYRYRPVGKSFFVDDYPTVNLIVAKKAFQEIGGFDNEFWPGEDTKFCLDLIRAGYKILYSSDLIVYHHRRELLRPHLRQVGNYGKHRGYFAKKFPQTSARVTYFVPSLFVIGNLTLLVTTPFLPMAGSLWLFLIALYFTLAALDVGIRTRRPFLGLLTVVTIFFSHLTYGLMFLYGLCSPKEFKSRLR